MSGYISKVVVCRPFEGDAVRVTLRPLGFFDKLRLEELFPEKDAADEIKKKAQRALTHESFVVMANYVEAVEGLFDQTGTAVPKDVMMRDAYFMELLIEVFQEWFKAASPRDPQQPAAASSAGSAGSLSRPPSLRSVPAALDSIPG